jgi:hypothetical protein
MNSRTSTGIAPDSPSRPLEAVLVPVEELRPFERNARTHSEGQVKQIAASIQEFGFLNPILIDDNRTVLAGHGRLLAANMLGLAEVPCVVFSHLSAAQKRAYVLADNRLAEKAGWDRDLIKLELIELASEGFNIELTGFAASELLSDLDTEQKYGMEMQYKVIITCDGETHQAQVLEKLEAEGLKCQALIA